MMTKGNHIGGLGGILLATTMLLLAVVSFSVVSFTVMRVANSVASSMAVLTANHSVNSIKGIGVGTGTIMTMIMMATTTATTTTILSPVVSPSP